MSISEVALEAVKFLPNEAELAQASDKEAKFSILYTNEDNKNRMFASGCDSIYNYFCYY